MCSVHVLPVRPIDITVFTARVTQQSYAVQAQVGWWLSTALSRAPQWGQQAVVGHNTMVLLLQVAGLKDKLAVVLSKTQNDDKLIAALRRELVAATGGKAGAGRSVHGCTTGWSDQGL